MKDKMRGSLHIAAWVGTGRGEVKRGFNVTIYDSERKILISADLTYESFATTLAMHSEVPADLTLYGGNP